MSGHLNDEVVERARQLIMSLYPHKRSALIPLCHLAQEQDGWLTPEAIDEIAELLGIAPAEVSARLLSTTCFTPSRSVTTWCRSARTSRACCAALTSCCEHAEEHLGMRTGATTADGMFTLEEAECLADCGRAPCLQVNHRFFGDVTNEAFDRLTDDLAAGRLSDEVPRHGTLVRIRRSGGLALAQASQVPTTVSLGAKRDVKGAAQEGSSAS